MLQELAILGFIISAYAFYVQSRLKEKKYKPLCDFKKNISCSKALGSNYGKQLIFHNSLYGMVYYALFLFAIFRAPSILFHMALLAVIVSAYLAYISYKVQRNYCLLCTTVYIINMLLLYYSI
ncbi:MAG: vitamin K epoxide reductase family protein [Candidatus Nanoarchaeia archaeon]